MIFDGVEVEAEAGLVPEAEDVADSGFPQGAMLVPPINEQNNFSSNIS